MVCLIIGTVGLLRANNCLDRQYFSHQVFQTKMIPRSLLKVCDFVSQFHFKKPHVPERLNTAVDFLSRLDINPKEKVILQIREDIQTTPIEVSIQSSDIHEEDQFYFLPEGDSETEEDI